MMVTIGFKVSCVKQTIWTTVDITVGWVYEVELSFAVEYHHVFFNR